MNKNPKNFSVTNKTFNWQGYNKNHKSHSILEMTISEVNEWARWNGFVIFPQKNGDIKLFGKKNNFEMLFKFESGKVKSVTCGCD